MPKLTVAPLASEVASSAVASGRRKPLVVSLVRKPVPKPVADSAARISERTDMVVVPLSPPPWLPSTLKVVAVTLATLAPAAELSEAPRKSEVAPPLGAAKVVTANVVAPPAPPLKVRTLPPMAMESVPRLSVAEDVAFPPKTSLPPWIVRFLPCSRLAR